VPTDEAILRRIEVLACEAAVASLADPTETKRAIKFAMCTLAAELTAEAKLEVSRLSMIARAHE